MRLSHWFALFFLVLASKVAWSHGVGQVVSPLSQNQKLLSAEALAVFSDDGGPGIQLRYTHKLSKKIIADAGAAMASGDRASRFFAGIDYELYPDYLNQPRISLKSTFERVNEFDLDRNTLTLAPILSKGFSFWGHEAYPFVSLPTGLSLHTDSSTYKTTVALATGISGKLPFKGYQKITASFELNVDLRNSFTGFMLGASYPL